MCAFTYTRTHIYNHTFDALHPPGIFSFPPSPTLILWKQNPHYVTQAGLELEVYLPQLPECWDHGCVPHLAKREVLSKRNFKKFSLLVIQKTIGLFARGTSLRKVNPSFGKSIFSA
jgi:hypothetical protein